MKTKPHSDKPEAGDREFNKLKLSIASQIKSLHSRSALDIVRRALVSTGHNPERDPATTIAYDLYPSSARPVNL